MRKTDKKKKAKMSDEELNLMINRVLLIHVSEEELTFHYDGTADSFTTARIKGHLKRCFFCSRRFENIKQIFETSESIEVPEELKEALLDALRKDNEKKSK